MGDPLFGRQVAQVTEQVEQTPLVPRVSPLPDGQLQVPVLPVPVMLRTAVESQVRHWFEDEPVHERQVA